MNNKGFIIEDCLICLLIVSILSSLCLVSYRLLDKNTNLYKEYEYQENKELEDIFNKCEYIP